MNEEELTYRIPNNQIHISKEKDEDCLIWISSKAINMANTIEELQQENKQLKEVIEEVRELIPKQLLSNVNITKYTDEMCLRDILQILDKAKEN